MSAEPETQAARITRICGVENLARWAGTTTTSVYRWNYAKEKGGSGGLIPVAYHQQILDGARAEGIDLTPEHFFSSPVPPVAEQPADSGEAAA